MENAIINCKRCGCRLQLPINKGVYIATCPKCRYEFRYDSGSEPAATSKASQFGGNYNSEAHPISRIVTIKRKTHDFNGWGIFGLQYRIKELRSVPIYINDRLVGTLNKNNKITVEIDSGQYLLRSSYKHRVITIPAGTEDYIVTYIDTFEGPGFIGIEPANDAFRDRLTEYMLNLFRSNRIQSQLRDYRYDGVRFYFNEKCIRLNWRNNKIYNYDEIINYSDAGLTPPPDKSSDYWLALESSIKNVILQDKQADVIELLNVLTLRSRNNSY